MGVPRPDPSRAPIFLPTDSDSQSKGVWPFDSSHLGGRSSAHLRCACQKEAGLEQRTSVRQKGSGAVLRRSPSA